MDNLFLFFTLKWPKTRYTTSKQDQASKPREVFSLFQTKLYHHYTLFQFKNPKIFQSTFEFSQKTWFEPFFPTSCRQSRPPSLLNYSKPTPLFFNSKAKFFDSAFLDSSYKRDSLPPTLPSKQLVNLSLLVKII